MVSVTRSVRRIATRRLATRAFTREWAPNRPGLNRHRSRRLRKKLHIGEFQQLAFDYDIQWSSIPDESGQNIFIDRFLDEVVVPRNLQLGGGLTSGALAGCTRNPTAEDQAAVRSWLLQYPGVVEVTVGPLVDAWYE